jgi:uncharacterized protein
LTEEGNMSFAKKFYEGFLEGAQAFAKWDLETSRNILGSKKRLLALALCCVPILLLGVAHATDALPHILGGEKAYGPANYNMTIFMVSILVGLAAGLITGCIGAGGGFIITPALMSVGVKGILAVGTDVFHIFAKAIMGTMVHKKMGNVSVPLAVAFLVGSGGGVWGGGMLNRALYEMNPVLSDMFISVVYVIILGFLGIYGLVDFIKLSRSGVDLGAHGGGAVASSTGKKTLPERLQSSKLPPLITFDEDLVPGGKQIPGLYVAITGALVGFIATVMGAGGGFVTFPIFVYVMGVSSFTTVGTDILQIIFTAGFAAISQYAIYGFIFYTLAMGMLLGSLLGIQIGAMTTRMVKGIYIRGFYATAVLAGFADRLFSLPGQFTKLEILHLSKTVIEVSEIIGSVIFLGALSTFAIWVIAKFLGGIKQLREE